MTTNAAWKNMRYLEFTQSPRGALKVLTLLFWGLGAACPASLGWAQSAPAAAIPNAAIIGEWDILGEGGKLSCRIGLEAKASGGERFALTVPPLCRRMIPELAKAASWTPPSENRIDILDAARAPLLSFVRRDGVLTADGMKGAPYTLTRPIDGVSAQTASIAAPPQSGFQLVTAPAGIIGKPETSSPTIAVAAAAPVKLAGVANAAPAGPAPRLAEISGRYAVLREVTRDTGCMLTLEPPARANGARAHLAPACRDNGIVIFEPVSWSFADGKLALTARKGHRAHFVRTEDGSWQKDPKEGGKPLGFRKM